MRSAAVNNKHSCTKPAAPLIYPVFCTECHMYAYGVLNHSVSSVQGAPGTCQGTCLLPWRLRIWRSRDRQTGTIVRLLGMCKHNPSMRQAAAQLPEYKVSQLEDIILEKRKIIPQEEQFQELSPYPVTVKVLLGGSGVGNFWYWVIRLSGIQNANPLCHTNIIRKVL